MSSESKDTENKTSDFEIENFKREDCKKNVKKWLHLDDQINLLKAKIKVLKNQQKEVSHYIKYFMKTTNCEELTFEGGSIQYIVKDKKSAISKKVLNIILFMKIRVLLKYKSSYSCPRRFSI